MRAQERSTPVRERFLLFPEDMAMGDTLLHTLEEVGEMFSIV
jgi:hypothetical protein